LKPTFRGSIHTFGLFVVIPSFLYALWDDIDRRVEIIAILILVIGNIICWGASSLFHCVPWTPKQEIFMQKVGKSIVSFLIFNFTF
jgi:predicted membrane channel-forming protein YqfA (hemolysin III family)